MERCFDTIHVHRVDISSVWFAFRTIHKKEKIVHAAFNSLKKCSLPLFCPPRFYEKSIFHAKSVFHFRVKKSPKNSCIKLHKNLGLHASFHYFFDWALIFWTKLLSRFKLQKTARIIYLDTKKQNFEIQKRPIHLIPSAQGLMYKFLWFQHWNVIQLRTTCYKK